MKSASLKTAVIFLSAAWLPCLATAQRLPKLAVPESYTLSFKPDFKSESFAGDETIEIRVLQPTSQIVLNAADIDFSETTISSRGKEQKATVAIDEKAQTSALSVAKALQPGPATLHIRYRGILSHDLRGFYLGTNEDGQKYVVTQFESTDARRAFPSFDEPAYKATFDITVVAPKQMTVISNSQALSDSPGPGKNEHTVHFATTPKMSSYLVAMVVGQFESIEGSADGIPIRVFTTPGRKHLAAFALESTENILRYYNKYFTIKYPYSKLDLIALPDFAAGAMENTACITFREILMLLDDKHASLAQRKRVASVIAHEIAHQWFGDMVTMQWWDDVWLNEGFASWMESKPVQAWKPEWNMPLDDVQDTVKALELDSLADTHPIHQAAETPAEIDALFDDISYKKGAAVLRMLESYLGEETFRRGVNRYLEEHRWGNATSANFWDALAQVSKKPVAAVMATFVNQPGPPLVGVRSSCAGSSTAVVLDQQRYFYDRAKLAAATSGPQAELWKIPVCLKAPTKRGKVETKCQLLSQNESKFTLPGCASWLLANAGAAGYYRSSYSPDAEHILAGDTEKALTPTERLMLLSDVWSAVRVGREPIGDYLELAQGMANDDSPAVVHELLTRLDYIGMYLADGGDRWAYQLWVRHLLEPVAQKLGFAPKPGEAYEQNLIRSYVLLSLGTTGGDPDVQAEARRLAHQALQNPDSVDPELTPVFLSIAAVSGDTELYDELIASLKMKRTPEQNDLYLRTLPHFSSQALLRQTLDFAVSPAVRSQDAARLAAAVLQNPAARDLAWDFVRAHWPDLTRNGGPFAGEQLVKAAGTFCDAESEDQLRTFFSAQPDLITNRLLNQSVESINYCLDLRSQLEHPLAAWLERHEGVAGYDGRKPDATGQRSIVAPRP